MKQLPVFEGYYVDVRLKQFRRVSGHKIEFIGFDSEEGENILDRYIQSLDSESEEFKNFIHHF